MRRLCVLPFLVGTVCWGQNAPHSSGIRPQAIVQVRVDSVGANLVTVSMLDPAYPPQLLAHQAEEIGTRLGETARGVQVMQRFLRPHDSATAIVSASFAVDHLIDPQKHIFRLQPIVQAFAGVPAPNTIRALLVDFDYQQIGPLSLNSYQSPSVTVSRRFIGESVEYQISLASQNPESLQIPDSATPPADTTSSVRAKAAPKADWITMFAFVVGGLATAALVYVVLTRAAPRKTRER